MKFLKSPKWIIIASFRLLNFNKGQLWFYSLALFSLLPFTFPIAFYDYIVLGYFSDKNPKPTCFFSQFLRDFAFALNLKCIPVVLS